MGHEQRAKGEGGCFGGKKRMSGGERRGEELKRG